MATQQSVHLVVLIHGLWGSPVHLASAKEVLEMIWKGSQSAAEHTRTTGPAEDPTMATTLTKDGREEELVVVVAGGMTSQLTYDGVDVCASRVAWEVDEQVAKVEEEGKKVARFSVTGYSLGGLVARYLVGLLHSRTPSFFEVHEPVSFSTIATPHYGMVRYNTFLSSTISWIGPRLLSRTGEQLYVADTYSDDDKRPLLEIMADPAIWDNPDLCQRVIFSRRPGDVQADSVISVNDRTVPYPTAAVDGVDPFVDWEERGLHVQADDNDIIQSWNMPSEDDDTKGLIKKPKSKPWFSVDKLPPALRYRFPFNYIILFLFPIMLPVIVVLILARSSLDTRKSRRRLQQLARTSASIPGTDSPRSPIPSASGLSVEHLRQSIRALERRIESPLIDLDSPDASFFHQPTASRSSAASGGLLLTETQLRIAKWLNSLPLKKYVSWYPHTANAHAVAVVSTRGTIKVEAF